MREVRIGQTNQDPLAATVVIHAVGKPYVVAGAAINEFSMVWANVGVDTIVSGAGMNVIGTLVTIGAITNAVFAGTAADAVGTQCAVQEVAAAISEDSIATGSTDDAVGAVGAIA